MDAVRECELDSWSVPRGDVRAGDRAIIWKAKGQDSQRGIVALAVVLTDPAVGLDPNRAYWVNPYREYRVNPNVTDEPVERVTVRYLLPPSLPLWVSNDAPAVLASLSVSRASGGSIFIVTPDQWQSLMKVIGGWPAESHELRDAMTAVTEVMGKPRVGQGYQTNPILQRAVEQYAMEQAIAHYAALGWHITDVSATQPYDLFGIRQEGEELRVEVKGTTSDGTQVLLTRNEVAHAKSHYPHVALFILSNIQLATNDSTVYEASGGQVCIYEPWRIDDDNLVPLAYAYTPPRRS